jgi:hypothetical protein
LVWTFQVCWCVLVSQLSLSPAIKAGYRANRSFFELF